MSEFLNGVATALLILFFVGLGASPGLTALGIVGVVLFACTRGPFQ